MTFWDGLGLIYGAGVLIFMLLQRRSEPRPRPRGYKPMTAPLLWPVVLVGVAYLHLRERRRAKRERERGAEGGHDDDRARRT